MVKYILKNSLFITQSWVTFSKDKRYDLPLQDSFCADCTSLDSSFSVHDIK